MEYKRRCKLRNVICPIIIITTVRHEFTDDDDYDIQLHLIADALLFFRNYL